jgi:PAS domain S-box-containing protein
MLQPDNLFNQFPDEFLGVDPRLLQNSLDSIEAGIYVIAAKQPETPIVYCNMAYEKMTGSSKEEIIGRNFLSYFENDILKRNTIKNTLEKNENLALEIQIRTKNESYLSTNMRLFPIQDADKAITHFIIIQYEIMGKKQTITSKRVVKTRNNERENGYRKILQLLKLLLPDFRS